MKPNIITVNGKEYCMIPLEEYNEIKDNILGFKPKRKVAFVVGHTETKQGDWSYLLESSEWSYWYNFLNDFYGDVFTHNHTINSYTERQKEMAERTKDYDLVIEFHFNAFDPDGNHVDNACGAEALVLPNLEMIALASMFISSMNENMGIKMRNVKQIMKGDNGHGFLTTDTNDRIILEPFFGDCKDDIDKFSEHKYKEVIDELIDYYYENIHKS